MYKILIPFLLIMSVNATPIATVNGKIITANDAQYFISQTSSTAKLSDLSGVEMIALRQRLVERELFLDSARKTKLEQSPQFMANMARLRDDLLIDMWLKEQMKFVVVSDGEAREFYNKNKDKFSEPTMVHAREIVVKSDTQAKQIILALKNLRGDMLKKTFIAMANYYSIDKTKQNGGDMGLMSKEQMSPSFASVAWSVPTGSIYTKPIKSNIGYHVVYMEDKLEHKLLAYESVKKDIVASLKQKHFAAYLSQAAKEMAGKAKIIYSH